LLYSEATVASVASEVPVAASAAAHIDEDSFALLKALAEGASVFIALTFIGGWSYLSAYYRTFGLNPLDFDFPVPVVCTTALYVLYDARWPLVLIGLLITALAFVARRGHSPLRGSVVVGICILLFAMATAGLFGGREAANKDMLDDPGSSALPYVAFATKTEFKGGARPSCVEWNSLGSADCKLLTHYKSTYYFFKPISPGGQNNLLLYALSESDLLAVHIERGLDRNEKVR
jgi:hypothetical protein